MTSAIARLTAAYNAYTAACAAHDAAYPVDLFRPLNDAAAEEAARPQLTAQVKAGELVCERGIARAVATAAQTQRCVTRDDAAFWGDVLDILIAAQAADGSY